MSYILDALKKSEQERGHGNIPGVQTVHTSSLNYHNKKVVWPYVLITAVLLNLAAIVYFYLDRDKTFIGNTAISEVNDDVNIQGIVVDKNNLNDSITKQIAITPPVINDPTPQENTPHNPEIIVSKEKMQAPPATTVTDNREDIIDFHDLPDSVKQQLPSIVVSAHVYSSNPLQRSIVINNNFLEEGEYVMDDLILQEITRNGAIFYYQGTRFRYGVVSGWQ
ncbi:MAG: general secretion pathway protein GspB [Gammaproteobacteria bacterium]